MDDQSDAPAPEGEAVPQADPALEPETAAEQPDQPLTQAQKIERAVINWCEATLLNSPLSRSTEAWNHLSAQLPKLAAFIEKEL